MLRLAPTGNATFDAAEIVAYRTYDQRMGVLAANRQASGQMTPGLLIAAEVEYYYGLWQTAMTQIPGRLEQDRQSSPVTVYKAPIASASVFLDRLAPRLATQLRNRGVVLPTEFYGVLSVALGNAGGTSYAAADVVTFAGNFLTPVGLTVATVAVGVVVTLSVGSGGLYNGPFSALAGTNTATTHSTGSGDDALTVTPTWGRIPVTYA